LGIIHYVAKYFTALLVRSSVGPDIGFEVFHRGQLVRIDLQMNCTNNRK